MRQKFAWLFIAGPILELVVMVQVAKAIGTGPMLLLLIAFSVAGFMLTKRVGRAAIQKLQARADATGARTGAAQGVTAVPPGAAADGALIGLAGVLVTIPGFVSGIVGFLLFIPPLRKLAAKRTARWAQGRVDAQFTVVGPAGPPRQRPGTAAGPSGDASDPRSSGSAPRDPGSIRRLPPGDVI